MAKNSVFQKSSAKEAIWSQLPDEVIESIFKWFPLESLARFRVVCKEWNDLLSSEDFLTWRRKFFKEHPWLLVVNERSDCYRLNVSTKEVKPFPVNRSLWASLGGILVTTNNRLFDEELFLYNPLTRKETEIVQMMEVPREECAIVCNPVCESFVQLPRSWKVSKEHGITVGDILWKGARYKVVAVHNKFIEAYDSVKQSWVIVQQVPERTATSIVFFKGLFFCIVGHFGIHDECGVMIFSIKDDCTCHMVNIFSPIPQTSPPWLEPYIFVCGSQFFLVRQDSIRLYLWELEYENNLSTNTNLSWKAISAMPQEVLEFANLGFDPQKPRKACSTVGWFKSFAAGSYICFVRERSGNVVFFNTQNRSWSCFSVVDNVEKCANADYAYGFEPKPEISFHY
ncbi:hypothetical protein SUGI_0539710 [Cryptomeria japonica]|uniref:uncharacterized protein LOC131040719 n=1 Tax=Cryptomeria japonica TaxID=3369 RepID=UPI002408B163|nr:uncharacterized protein LOC131040719 [Cryptomeria japonica]GLJ27512.1 hypothetical protein SUGI_0539710 [Cryptomeria japonica]